MALFGLKKSKTNKQDGAPTTPARTGQLAHVTSSAKTKNADVAAMPPSGSKDLSGILLRPHVTEKATDLSGRGVYAFDVHRNANKALVAAAVAAYYKVTPYKVAIVPGREKVARNYRSGQMVIKRKGIKKALVYLKKGDKIEFV